MSSIAFRDSSVAVIETGRTQIRAILGLADLLKTPSVEIPARVGLRRNGVTSRPTFIQSASSDGAGSNSASRAASQPARSVVGVGDYLVGQQLDNAIAAGEDLVISWPFADGEIQDFLAAEALWKYVLFTLLGLKRTHNESPALLTFVHGLSRDTHERICQIFFERFNVASLSILERPLAQLYAANALNGLIIDIDENQTDITPISDCFIHSNACDTLPIGLRDCELYLASILKANESVIKELSPPDAPLEPAVLQDTLLELVRQVWKGGHIKLVEDAQDIEEEGVTNIAAVLVAGKEKAVIETGMKKRANAKATAAEQARAKEIEALDLVTIEFREKSISLGRERHKFLDPIFDPSVLHRVEGIDEKLWHDGPPMPIQDVCGQVVSKTELDARLQVWDGLFVTGDCANAIKGIATAIQARLSPFMLGNPDQLNDVQPKQVRVLHVPEYFAEYREKGDRYAAFLGASIVAKVIFSDPHGKNFVSKTDYGTKGPRAVLEMSPSLL